MVRREDEGWRGWSKLERGEVVVVEGKRDETRENPEFKCLFDANQERCYQAPAGHPRLNPRPPESEKLRKASRCDAVSLSRGRTPRGRGGFESKQDATRRLTFAWGREGRRRAREGHKSWVDKTEEGEGNQTRKEGGKKSRKRDERTRR